MPLIIRPNGASDLSAATIHEETALPQNIAKSAGTYQVGRVIWSPNPVTVGAGTTTQPTNPTSSIAQPSNSEPVDTDFEGVQWALVQPPPTPAGRTMPTVFVPPGATRAYVPLTLDRAPLASVTVREMYCSNASGGNINIGSSSAAIIPALDPWWRPGDDLVHYVTLDLSTVSNKVNGAFFNFNYRPSGTGYADVVGDHSRSVRIEFQTGAINGLPAQMPYHRNPYRYTASGTPLAALDIGNVQWSDTGYVGNASSGTPCLQARLPHGYIQPGNGEEGLYMNGNVWPTEGADAQQRITDSAGRKAIRLHTKRLSSPLGDPVHGGAFNYMASMVSTKNMMEFNGRHGLWRSLMRTPSRRGAWSAWWVIGRHPTGSHRWPPEIDMFEHFNSGEYPTAANGGGRMTTSAVHYGYYGSNNRAGSRGAGTPLNRYGFDSSVDLYTQIHEYAVLIHQNGYVYHFRDGIETYCHYNAAVPEDAVVGGLDWRYFFMFNVAVKGGSSTYDDGNGDLDIYSFERFTGNQVTLSSMDDPKPWPNRKITPDPILGNETAGGAGSGNSTAPSGVTSTGSPSEVVGSRVIAPFTTGQATARTVNHPAATAGNLRVLYVSPDKTAAATLTEGGWTEHESHGTGTGVSGALFSKRATGGESSIGFTTSNSVLATAVYMEFTGVHASTPVAASAKSVINASTAARTTGEMNAGNSNVANQIVVAFASNDSNGNVQQATSGGWSNNFVEIAGHQRPGASASGTSEPFVSVAQKAFPTVGASRSTAYTYSGGLTDEIIGMMIAINPA